MLGLLAYGVLHLQLLLTGRFTWFAPGFGHGTLLQFHRQTGVFALLVLTHSMTLFLADRSLLAYLDPRIDALRAVSLGLLLLAALVLVGSSPWRLGLGLSYEWLRLMHGVLALAIVATGVGHPLLVGHYSAAPWKQVAFVTMTLLGVYLVLHSRLVRPLLARRRPYRIVEVRRQRAQATTLVLEPESSAPLLSRPGQFILLTIGDSPLSMQQHPFSLASSAPDRRVELTAKGSGDFTGGLARVATGRRSWLERPYGAFTLDLDKACGAVFIAGGVGITPFMSMLRTYRDRGSKFPLVLLYCSSSWDEVIFRDEHEALQAQMQLTLVHVLQQAPEGWHGESGYLDAAMLDRHLPVDPIGHEYFICGPAPRRHGAPRLLRTFRHGLRCPT